LGWDDFQVRTYRAWMHKVALMATATWFVTIVKLK
jgi:hypothetical protein